MTSDQVANQLLERMQQSGERDRIKEWLMNDLETTGWTSALLEKVTQLRSSSDKSASENTSAADATSSSQSDQLTVRRISSQLSKEALASVPDTVRSKLMQELLDICRQYVASENFASSSRQGNK
ncbi:Transcription factor e(y)2 [Gracilaria domingensis]|nr:Transcription factor e(y)2 [Gracilaria domingensis]